MRCQKNLCLIKLKYEVGCGGNGDRIICNAVFSADQSAALALKKEFPSLILSCQSHLADMYLSHWLRGLPTALDVAVITCFQQQALLGAGETQYYAPSVVEVRKRAAHATSCRTVRISFSLVLVVSLGWKKLAAKTFRSIGHFNSNHCYSPSLSEFFKGNAALRLHDFLLVPLIIKSIICLSLFCLCLHLCLWF